MKKLKIGICGWGNVATGLFNVLKYNNERITSNGNLEIEIVVIGARRDNPKCNPGDIKIERDIFDVIDNDIDVVVELIGGVEVARDLIFKLLKIKNMLSLQIRQSYFIMEMKYFKKQIQME